MCKHIIITVLMLAICSQVLAGSIQDSYLAEARGDYLHALTLTQELADEDPEDLFYTMRIAWLQYLSGNYHSALNSYLQAQKKLDHKDARIGIINCRLALAEWDNVISYCELLLADAPHDTLLLSKAAYAAYIKKSYASAADYFARILQIAPWDMENRAYLVNNLYLSGNIEAAKAQYKSLKKYYPQSQIVIDYREILDSP